MSKHQVSYKAVCPYYKHEDSSVIYCEGVQEGTVVHLAFSNRTEAKAYKCQYCKDDYPECYIAAMHEMIEEDKIRRAKWDKKLSKGT